SYAPIRLQLPSVFALFCYFYFLFNEPTTPENYTLSLHDALPIWVSATRFVVAVSIQCTLGSALNQVSCRRANFLVAMIVDSKLTDRKSTRLNSSHVSISYAVFCLKKKNKFS